MRHVSAWLSGLLQVVVLKPADSPPSVSVLAPSSPALDTPSSSTPNAFAVPTKAANIILSNDDGWAELNVRTFYNTLTAAGERVVLSAPAENKSGTGSLDADPTVTTRPCEFDSCPEGSPAYGFNASDPRLNYVNSYPVTSIKYGIMNLSEEILGGPPVLAVTGPNVGNNLNLAAFFSGTVGAATEASKLGLPALSFSGKTGTQTSWTTVPIPNYALVYADLATNLTQTILSSTTSTITTQYLPRNTWLNVNFGASTTGKCASAESFKFVLTRILPAVPLLTPDDVEVCGSRRLPTETEVMGFREGCWVSVSVGLASDKRDAGAAEQAFVLERLGHVLSCLD